MPTIENSATLAATPETVWAYMSDLERFGEWLTIHREWRTEPLPAPALGATATQAMSVMNIPLTVDWTVERCEPPRVLALSGIGTTGLRLGMTSTGGADGDTRTTVSIAVSVEGRLVAGPLGDTVAASLWREFDTSLAKLAAIFAGER